MLEDNVLPWNEPARWQRLLSGADCPLCHSDRRSEAVCELSTAILSVPAAPCLRGYACLAHRRHVVELHDLNAAEAAAFVLDLNRVSAAVQRITGAVKLNLASYGNVVPHLHVHICPRKSGDAFDGRPLDFGHTDPYAYAAGEHAGYVAALRAALAVEHRE